MSSIEWFLVIGAVVAPLVAILFVLPKLKKKKTFETTEYVPEEKEKNLEQNVPVVEEKKEVPKVEFKNPFENKGGEFENYKEYLARKREQLTSPQRNDVNNMFPGTQDYFSYRRRKKMEAENKHKEADIFDPDIQALLIAGILDRKF